MKDSIESLKKQEEELEKLIAGTPEDKATTESEATKSQAEQKEAPTENKGAVTPESQSATDEQHEVKKDQEDWKLRYTNLRSSRDENLYKAKRELVKAQETINDLHSQIESLRTAQPKVDPLAGVFTDEDTDALGEATIEAMRRATSKATEAATRPLQEQLEMERKARLESNKMQAENTQREVYNIFLSRIAKAVPDWEEINYDPEFVEFMSQEDLDGTPRKTYFAEAEAQGNAALIIRYMQEYKGTRPAPKEDKLAKKVTPLGEDAGATQLKDPEKVTVITREYINKFYDDLARGRYKGRHTEAQEIESRIDKATMEGHIR